VAAYERHEKDRKSRTWQVTTTRASSLEIILKALLPYLRSKRERAWLALVVIRCRQRQTKRPAPEIYELCDRIKAMNKNPAQPDREAVETIGVPTAVEDIVQAR
jgi:hypothetical protein